ncbi:MAG: hypothetical protein AAGK05_04100 [Pseudomonadota bacterium]
MKKKILKIDAVPSIFPHFPSYLQGRATSRRSERATSTSRLDSENLDLLSSIAAFEEDDVITSLDDLKSKFRASTSTSNFVLIENICNDSLVFAEFADDLPPKVVKSVVVSQELSFVAYEGNNTLPDHVYKSGMKFSSSIVRFSDFLNLLAYVHNHVMESAPLVEAEKLLTSHAENADISSITVQKLFFICEQLQFLINPKKCFSANLLTLGILWKAHSTSCYKAILSEGVLTLPSLRTLRRVAQNFSYLESDTSQYLALRVENLNSFERCVILLFDEIYVYQTIEYDCGKFVGLSSNDSMPATTILCFMIKSLAGKYSDVVACIPIHRLTVECLRSNCLKVLNTVMQSGFNVIALCADNHAVNRSFFKGLSTDVNSACENPCNAEKKLYLLIDPVHTIKNLYNNFQKRTNFRMQN